jgi:hypothetical protein
MRELATRQSTWTGGWRLVVERSVMRAAAKCTGAEIKRGQGFEESGGGWCVVVDCWKLQADRAEESQAMQGAWLGGARAWSSGRVMEIERQAERVQRGGWRPGAARADRCDGVVASGSGGLDRPGGR